MRVDIVLDTDIVYAQVYGPNGYRFFTTTNNTGSIEAAGAIVQSIIDQIASRAYMNWPRGGVPFAPPPTGKRRRAIVSVDPNGITTTFDPGTGAAVVRHTFSNNDATIYQDASGATSGAQLQTIVATQLP